MLNNSVQMQSDLARRFPGSPFGKDTGEPPHLHLYHTATSICAQKVRATFAWKGIPYMSHELDLARGDSYEPVYVRVRMEGCRAANLNLVSDHSGSTSVTTSGCDPCVVPTVIDDRTQEVIVDSRHICLELDRRYGAASDALVPSHLREAIEAELALVDDMPNYQLLASMFGRPTADAPTNAFAVAKVTRCEALLAEHGSDPILREAYEAKRAKELVAVEKLFDSQSLALARERTIDMYRGLADRLTRTDGPYLFGDQVTMADLFWAVELIRADDLGLADIWTGGELPLLNAYYSAMCALPAVQEALVNYPGARFNR